MSLLSRIVRLFSNTPPVEPTAPAQAHPSRHERREAGRRRHHDTGEPAWEAGDRLEQGAGETKNPDAAPEILGGG